MLQKFLSALPALLVAAGSVATAIAGHNYGQAATGAFTIVQQLLAIWALGGAGVMATGVGLLSYHRAVAKAEQQLPTPAPGDTTEDHLLGLLAQELARKQDKRLSKVVDLFQPLPE